jgi:hypothetical protein
MRGGAQDPTVLLIYELRRAKLVFFAQFLASSGGGTLANPQQYF